MTATAAPQEETIPLRSRVWVSAADGAMGMLNAFVAAGALTYYFTSLRGLDFAPASMVWLIFGVWNAINDPLFGYISDRTKSSLGRRIPYIRYGAPIISLAFIACWIAWPTPALTPYANGEWWTSPAQLSMFWQFLVALFIYDTLWTAIATSIYIMPYEMAVSNKARSSVFVWKVPFQLIANLAPLAIPFIKPQPGDDPTMFRWLVIGLGVFLGVVVYASTYFYEEKHFQQDEPQPPFFRSLFECFKNKAFVVFEVLSFTVICEPVN